MEENEVRRIFANNLKRMRKQRGLSQLKMANELQMALTFISDIENCKKWISPETLARFATFFQCSISDFFIEEKDFPNQVNPQIFAQTLENAICETIKNVKTNFSL